MSTATVDLSMFCDPDSYRYAFDKPFVQGEVRYATDAKIIVAVPAPGEPDTDVGDRRVPKCAHLFDGYDKVTEWHELPGVVMCGKCEGVGRAVCPKCNGRGEHRCSCGCEHDCQWCDEKDNKIVCDCFSTLGEFDVATWIIERVRNLPEVRWGVSACKTSIFLQFDGGRGAMMPLDPKRKREYA